MFETKDISRRLSDTLDAYGYSTKRVKERIWMNNKTSKAKTLSTQDILNDPAIAKFLVGSLREGISLCGESDQDWMQVHTSVVCTKKLRHIKEKRDEMIILRLDMKNAPAGYTNIRYNSQDSNTHPYVDKLKHALHETEKGTFLSSSKYMEMNEDVFYNSPGIIGRNTVYKDRQGPSIPKTVVHSGAYEAISDQYDICNDMDFVRGFQCYCPSLVHKWLNRKRSFNWPDKETKTRISTMPYHVVPTGLAGTENAHLQWRISFTMAEVCLVQSLNDTQRKLLILLRLMARHLLKPVAPDITSYIMKNVVFWMVEGTPAESFTTDQLFDRILDAIDFLIKSIKKKNLPNYMIQGRNILRGKFEGEQRKILLAKLKEMKANGKTDLSKVLWSPNIHREYPKVADWLINTDFKSRWDKIQTVAAFPISLSQQAAFFTASFRCYFGLMMIFLHLQYYKHCLPVFGMKWFSDPLSIDLIERAKEPKTYFYKGYLIARNKAKTHLLFRLQRCTWLYYKALQIFGTSTNQVLLLMAPIVLTVLIQLL